MGGSPKRRRASWMRSQSESFGPIRQVGVAVSIGVPLLAVGVLMLALLVISIVEVSTFLWILAAALVGAGLVAAAIGRVI
jgi:hypothetical protein